MEARMCADVHSTEAGADAPTVVGRQKESGNKHVVRKESQTVGTVHLLSASLLHCSVRPLPREALFRLSQNFKFFRSLSITLIFKRIYGALNVGKKITNYIGWL